MSGEGLPPDHEERMGRARLALLGLSVGDAFGDRDTTCAIVGGIVALAVGGMGIPEAWIHAREPLPVDA